MKTEYHAMPDTSGVDLPIPRELSDRWPRWPVAGFTAVVVLCGTAAFGVAVGSVIGEEPLNHSQSLESTIDLAAETCSVNLGPKATCNLKSCYNWRGPVQCVNLGGFFNKHCQCMSGYCSDGAGVCVKQEIKYKSGVPQTEAEGGARYGAVGVFVCLLAIIAVVGRSKKAPSPKQQAFWVTDPAGGQAVSNAPAQTQPVAQTGGKDDGASLASTVINTIKSIMGAGILTLSWALYFSSLWPGVIGTLFMCVISAYGFYLIGMVSEKTGGDSFGGMWSQLYGSGLAWIPDMVIVLFCSCCIISYLIVCSDYLPKGLGGFGVPEVDRSVYILGASLVVLPLNFMEDLSVLTYTSVIGNFSVFYTTGLLLVLWLSLDVDDYGDWEPWVVQPGLFVTLPTMAFSFNGHFGAPKMYQQLSGKSPEKWLKVTLMGFGACLPLVFVCALSGYFMFGSDVMLPGRSNVLMAPSMKGPPVMVAFIGMTLAVLFGVPIHTNTVRNAINGIWVRAMKLDPQEDSTNRKRMLSAITIVFTNAVALSTDALGLAVAVNGAVCATLMMYILPAMMYMKACGPSALPKATLVLGVIIGITGVTTSVMVGAGMTSDLRW